MTEKEEKSSPAKWAEFFQRYCKAEISSLKASGTPREKTLLVDYAQLQKFSGSIANQLLEEPDIILEHAHEGFRDYAHPHMVDVDKVKFNLRFVNLPEAILVRDLRDEHIGKMVKIEATVRNTTAVLTFLLEAAFKCARCQNITLIPQEMDGKFIKPSYCSCDEEKKGVFSLVYSQCKKDSYQRLKVQESPDDLRGGERPETIDVNVTGDLVRLVTAGDRITVNGIVRMVQRKGKEGETPFFDTYIDANAIEIQENEYADIELTQDDIDDIKELSTDKKLIEKIVQSIAPSIFGFEKIKYAVALQMFSGQAKNMPDGSRLRGDIHILLVGDPGIAKSQLLRYVAKIAPRGVYASGKSASAAGLTAAAVKDDFDGQWTLEAGACVLADKGTVCIDEMDKMKSEDKAALHEVAEQQTISVAKAGINAQLRARCAILGAANPKYSRFDPYQSFAEQVEMPDSLKSRFDLIFILRDVADEKKDKELSDHILTAHLAGELCCDVEYDEDPRKVAAMKVITPEIPPEMLKKYVAYARQTVKPVMSDEARAEIQNFYLKLRKAKAQDKEDKLPMPITARQQEAIVRLAEASAKMRLSKIVTADDAKRVIEVILESMKQCGIDPETGLPDADMFAGGMPKSQRDRVTGLKHVFDALRKEKTDAGEYKYPNGIPENVLAAMAAEKMNMTPDKFEREIKKLKEIGSVFAPKNGYWSWSD